MKRSTLVAAAVLALLAGLAYWLEREDGSSENRDSVFGVSEDDIRRVEIRRGDGERVVIERDEGSGSFRVVAPISAATDGREVELLLSNLTSMTAMRTIDVEERDLAEFGLETAPLEVRFTTRAGDELGVRFGNDTLTPSSQYAQRLDSEDDLDILIVGAHLSGNLDKTAWELRDKRIFPMHDEEVDPIRVAVTHGDERFELVSDSGGWRTATPPRARVDRFEVVGLVARLRRAEMLEIVEPAAAIGLDPPVHRVHVSFSGESLAPIALEIGHERNVDYYARVPSEDRVFVIEGGLAEDLSRDASAYWSDTLTESAASDVTEIRIEGHGEDRTLDGDDAQDLAGALSSTRADEVVTRLPSSEAEVTITITGAEESEGNEREERLFFHRAGDAVYVRRDDEDVARRLAADAWLDLEAKLSFQDR